MTWAKITRLEDLESLEIPLNAYPYIPWHIPHALKGH